MKTGSLRRRTVLATLMVLVATLGAFATVVTVRYSDGLRRQARSQLLAAARAIRDTPGAQLKPLGASLALEGINVQFTSRAVVDGPGVLHDGSRLLSYSEPVNINGSVITAVLSSSQASVNDAVNRLITIELIGAALVLIAASVVSWLALSSALEPLRHVAAIAQRIAHGDRRLRLRPQHPDTELGKMAASFDAMVDSLEEAVTQATRSEAAMRRFLADASHELRTPIAALQATSETLLRKQPERPKRDRLEADIARGSQRLGRLADDLLNLARLQANEPLRTDPVDVVELSKQLINSAQTLTTARISLTHDMPATVRGDPDALARALRNMLDNAIRAAGEQGEILIEIQSSADRVRLSVTDNGPGVPPAERERIFDGFVRLGTTPGTGTGLGLAIARAIAHQHGGEIHCEDTHTGARFTLELPTIEMEAASS